MRAGWIRVGGFVAAAAMLSASASLPAQQQVISGRATSFAEQRQALAQANAQAAQARAVSRQMEQRARSATAEADRLNARSAALAALIQQSEAELRAGVVRVALISRMITIQQARLAARQGPLVRLVAALQSMARRPPVLALVQPGSLTDAVHMRAAFAQVLPVIQQRTVTLRAELARSRQLRAMAVQAAASLTRGRTLLTQQRIELSRLESAKRIAARGLASGASIEAERATALGEEARDIGALMQELEAAGDVRTRLASLPGPELRPRFPGQADALPVPGDEARSGTGGPPAYRLPVVGVIVTGMGELSQSGVRSRGLTIAAQPGAQIVAPADGRIAFAGPYRGFGQIIIVDHGGGWVSLVTDLARITARVGEGVRQGAPVGMAGASANPTITVELRRQGRPVDILAMAGEGS